MQANNWKQKGNAVREKKKHVWMISQRTERFCIYFDFILRNSDFDFMLYYNLLLCFTPLEMHVRLICAIKFYALTYYVL